MRTVLSWLCDFADFESLVDKGDQFYIDKLIDVLTEAMNERGFVVEGVERIGFDLNDVVVARVVEIDAIKGADRIRRILVDAGRSEHEQIVCGAFNFVVGNQVPLARVGAILPGNFEIGARKMKGVQSNGMLCSSRELGLGEDSDGLMLLDDSLVPGTGITTALGIVPDVVFDLAIEANRPDANCHLGVARELAVHFNLDFSIPFGADLSQIDHHKLPLGYLGDFGTNSLMLASFKDISGCQVEDFVVRRLALAGMRSVSPIVDASNYVMIELGQPTHPYDLDKLASADIRVRPAFASESIVTLDGQNRTLAFSRNPGDLPVDLVIVDQDDKPIGIAGIMGGGTSEISDSTKTVLLEVANFSADLIAKTSKRLGLRSEASARFERGVDPNIATLALERYCGLLSISPESISSVNIEFVPTVIALRVDQIKRILGQELPMAELYTQLEKMGFLIQDHSQGSVWVQVPSNRPDITIEADLIEEFARHYGYHRIARKILNVPSVGKLTKRQILRRELIDFSIARGYFEAWTPSLLAPDEQRRLGDELEAIRVSNPMAIEESVLRRSLLSGLLRSAGANIRRRFDQINLFEVGSVFSHSNPDEIFPVETERIGYISFSSGNERSLAFMLYQAMVERFSLDGRISFRRVSEIGPKVMAQRGYFGMHPTRSVALMLEDEIVGVVGEVDPYLAQDVAGISRDSVLYYLELDFDQAFYERVLAPHDLKVSQFPSASFDLCFGVSKERLSRELQSEMEQAITSYVGSITLIDIYEGAALKDVLRSLTYRVLVASMDHTLVESEIRAIRQAIIDQIERKNLGQLRN